MHPFSSHLARLGITQWVPRGVADAQSQVSHRDLCVCGVAHLDSLPFGKNLLVHLSKAMGAEVSFADGLSASSIGLVVYDDQLPDFPQARASLESLLHDPEAKKRLWHQLQSV